MASMSLTVRTKWSRLSIFILNRDQHTNEKESAYNMEPKP